MLMMTTQETHCGQTEARAAEAPGEQYREPVFRAALTLLRDSAAAEEVTQQCLERLRTEMAGRALAEPPLLWLYRQAIELSRERLLGSVLLGRTFDTLFHRLDRLQPGFSRRAFADSQVGLERALASVPCHHRLVLTLYYLGGLRLKEIARVTQCPVGTVKSRLHYGRRALRRALTPDAAVALQPA
jgi:RNA polymerase sigma-70 factor (ECF subfamily)